MGFVHAVVATAAAIFGSVLLHADAAAVPDTAWLVTALPVGRPKNWANRTSFHTLSGVLTENTAAETIVPVGAVSLSRNLSTNVSLVFAVKYVTAYNVHTTKTALVEKKRRGCRKGQRRCCPKVRNSGRPCETLSTTDLVRV